MDIVVFAGHLTSDPSQGVLVRQASGDDIPNETHVELPVLKTPSRSGAARIANADGDLLTIALADGTRISYDAGKASSSSAATAVACLLGAARRRAPDVSARAAAADDSTASLVNYGGAETGEASVQARAASPSTAGPPLGEVE